jgi:hypothetical protein
MLNAIEAGTTTGAQLQTLLTDDPGRLAELNVLLGMRGQARRMAASSTAMAAVIASSTAMAAVIASSTAMTAVAASSTAMTAVAASSAAMDAVAASSAAMTAVAASSTAMTAVAASSTAKMAVFNSDTALADIAASATALTAMRAAAQYAVYETANVALTSPTALIGTNASASYIALGVSTSDITNGATITIATRHPGSARANTHVTDVTSVSLTTALGALVMPMVTPFTFQTTDGNPQTGRVGMLRCDI